MHASEANSGRRPPRWSKKTDQLVRHVALRCRPGLQSELLVANLIVADRRFELSFEAYGARRLGPDLTVAFRTNQRFNIEVTRLRTTGDAGTAGS